MITRLEVIDHRACRACKGSGIAPNKEVCVVCGGTGTVGRSVIASPDGYRADITYDIQDNGRTLKVFLADPKEATK